MKFEKLSDEEWLAMFQRDNEKLMAFRSLIAGLPSMVPPDHPRYNDVQQHYRQAGKKLREIQERYEELQEALPILEAKVARRKADLRTIAAGREMIVLEETDGEMALAQLKQMKLFKRILTIRCRLLKLLADMIKAIDYAQARLGCAGGMELPLMVEMGNERREFPSQPFPPASSNLAGAPPLPGSLHGIGNPPGEME